MANQLSAIKHIVQPMLDNRSFDQMLGFYMRAAATGRRRAAIQFPAMHTRTPNFARGVSRHG
jgi:phospholipase C